DPKKSLSTELPKEEVKEPLPTTEEPSVVHNAMPETPLDPQTESKQNKSKPPELNIVPSDPNQPDKIHQILDTDEVLDPMSKTLSPFEQNLVSFGQHFNFIPSPEPEKWPEEEEEVSAEAAEEQESILEEEELTPYQAALKKKYEEESARRKPPLGAGTNLET
ncbi:SET domain containing (Lysine methyltransferase) 7 manatus, partial [Caligus rogercresseyi]